MGALAVAAALAGGGAAAAGPAVARHGAPPAAAPRLPADWPASLRLPTGTLVAATGRAPAWSVQLVVRGSAAQVRRRAIAFYRRAGFRTVANATLRRGALRIVVVVENRDHSAAKTFLVLGVTRTRR